MNKITNLIVFLLGIALFSCQPQEKKQSSPLPSPLKISENDRFFTDSDGKPFFWLGDTGWLLFTKLSRQDAEKYLDDRAKKGFNVIQIMVLHSLEAKNIYGDSALVNQDIAHPLVTGGNSFDKPEEYDYWDNINFIIDEAAKRGLYAALVPVWGNNVKTGKVSVDQARAYATFLAQRYKDKPNIIWVNGGDIQGSDSIDVWNTIGQTLKLNDPNHLVTFHPFGRTMSSMWFQNESWLDFNMFQSGHRRYDQDDSDLAYGEDNWKYVETDYNLTPVKPVLDGEPSYEGIPQGLHDTLQPYWNADDIRRYAYWSVFAGACGFTYGNSAVMQFYNPADKGSAYGAKEYWTEAINDPGAKQMIWLKKLILSRPYFERIPDQTLIAGENGEKYNYLIATRGKDYAFVYTWTGRNIPVSMGKIEGTNVDAEWYNPRNGETIKIGKIANTGTHEFDPPGEEKNGNDWVLVLDSEK